MIADEINTNAQNVRICVPAVVLIQSAITPRRTLVVPSILNGTRNINAPRIDVTRKRITVACENLLPIDVVASDSWAVIPQSHWLSEYFACGSVTATEFTVAGAVLARVAIAGVMLLAFFAGPATAA